MGAKYVGGSLTYRSIGQNLLAMKSSYGFACGYFGKNDGHSNNSVRTIYSNNPVDTAKQFFSRLSYGGIDISKNGTTMTQTHDGSIITYRVQTSSPGSPAVDINIVQSTHAAGIKKQKIHFAVPKEAKK